MAAAADRWAIPTPFPVGPVNAWRLDGKRAALIDAGPNTDQARDALLSRLKRSPVRTLVLSHEHVDHSGLAASLQAEHGVEVHMHHRDAEILRTWEARRQEREDDHQAALVAADVPSDLVERMRHGGRKYDGWGQTLRPDATFTGGDRVQLGDLEYEVVDAPGHTPGSHLLVHGATTFTGDTLLEHITPNALSVKAKERRALADYLASLRRLQGRDWGTAHPGHGPAFGDVGSVIARNLRHADDRQRRIVAELQAGPSTVWSLVGRLFPRLDGREVFLAVSEVLGHLECLRLAGQAAVDRRDGIDHYSLAGQSQGQR